MTVIEQLVEDYKSQNPTASDEDIRKYIQSLEQHTKVIKEDEWAFNMEHADSETGESEGKIADTKD